MPEHTSAAATESLQETRPHSLVLESRSRLSVSGVQRVISCDETGVTMRTSLGDLTVGGQELQMSELSVHSGELHLTGKIEYLQYSENRESSGGLLARLLH